MHVFSLIYERKHILQKNTTQIQKRNMDSKLSGRVSAIPPLSRYSSLFDNNKKGLRQTNCSESNHRPQTSPNFPDRRSKNPFFVRNAPHPVKVRHLKGLLDAPVCMVDDTLYEDQGSARQNKGNQAAAMTHRGFSNLRREKFLPGIGMGKLCRF